MNTNTGIAAHFFLANYNLCMLGIRELNLFRIITRMEKQFSAPVHGLSSNRTCGLNVVLLLQLELTPFDYLQ